MKLKPHSADRGDISLPDLFAILAAVAIVGLLGYSYLVRSRRGGSYISCVNNLKQIGLSYRLWASDNNEKMPAQISRNQGGTKEFIAAGKTFRHFQVMSNELGSLKIIRCPRDSIRPFATNWELLQETNVGYFVVPEADVSQPEIWLSGDRNLATASLPLWPGLFWLPTNRAMSWTATIHTNQGNICFADGSVQQLTSAKLQQSATNALRAYREATTNTTFRLLIP